MGRQLGPEPLGEHIIPLVMAANALKHFLWLVSTAALFAFSVSGFEAAGIEPLEVSHRKDKGFRACNL